MHHGKRQKDTEEVITLEPLAECSWHFMVKKTRNAQFYTVIQDLSLVWLHNSD